MTFTSTICNNHCVHVQMLGGLSKFVLKKTTIISGVAVFKLLYWSLTLAMQEVIDIYSMAGLCYMAYTAAHHWGFAPQARECMSHIHVHVALLSMLHLLHIYINWASLFLDVGIQKAKEFVKLNQPHLWEEITAFEALYHATGGYCVLIEAAWAHAHFQICLLRLTLLGVQLFRHQVGFLAYWQMYLSVFLLLAAHIWSSQLDNHKQYQMSALHMFDFGRLPCTIPWYWHSHTACFHFNLKFELMSSLRSN